MLRRARAGGLRPGRRRPRGAAAAAARRRHGPRRAAAARAVPAHRVPRPARLRPAAGQGRAAGADVPAAAAGQRVGAAAALLAAPAAGGRPRHAHRRAALLVPRAGARRGARVRRRRRRRAAAAGAGAQRAGQRGQAAHHPRHVGVARRRAARPRGLRRPPAGAIHAGRRRRRGHAARARPREPAARRPRAGLLPRLVPQHDVQARDGAQVGGVPLPRRALPAQDGRRRLRQLARAAALPGPRAVALGRPPPHPLRALPLRLRQALLALQVARVAQGVPRAAVPALLRGLGGAVLARRRVPAVPRGAARALLLDRRRARDGHAGGARQPVADAAGVAGADAAADAGAGGRGPRGRPAALRRALPLRIARHAQERSLQTVGLRAEGTVLARPGRRGAGRQSAALSPADTTHVAGAFSTAHPRGLTEDYSGDRSHHHHHHHHHHHPSRGYLFPPGTQSAVGSSRGLLPAVG